MVSIKSVNDIEKLLAFLRMNSKTVFDIAEQVAPEIGKAIQEFAREHRVNIEVVGADEERVMLFTAAGGLAGTIVGGILFGIPGAVLGGGAGALAGYGAAHISIKIVPSEKGGSILTIC